MAPKHSAQDLKEKGNVAFKNGNFREAAKLYAKAQDIAPTDPVYSSNLSAALYEAGDYAGCRDAVLRSWTLMAGAPDAKLALRLSTRLARALINGARSGAISEEDVKAHAALAGALRAAAESGEAATQAQLEHVHVWGDWERVWDEMRRVAEGADGACERLTRIPIFRKGADPGREFFHIGSDDVISFLDGWGGSRAASDSRVISDPINLKQMPLEQLSNIALLLGGAGDGRHAFGSVVGVHNAWKTLKKERQDKLKVHMTLVDWLPTCLARDLVFFMLVNELLENIDDKVAAAEIKTTLLMTFLGVVLPPYCHARLENAVNELVFRLSAKPPRLPSWLHVDADSIVPILTVLRWWQTFPTRGRTTRGILVAHGDQSMFGMMATLGDSMTSPKFKAKFNKGTAAQRKRLDSVIDGLTTEDIRKMGLLPEGTAPEEARAWIGEHREQIKTLLMTSKDSGLDTVDGVAEKTWYVKTKTFVLPEELRSRHPGFEDLFRYAKIGELDKAPKSLLQQVNNHIEKTWKMNFTYFDPAGFDHPSLTINGYPALSIDSVTQAREFGEFLDRMKLHRAASSPDGTSFLMASAFFDHVVAAFKELESHVKLEFIVGELNQELSKMRLGTDRTRPEDFPRLYTRAWLNNVPDYAHGPLNAALFVLPIMQSIPEARVGANCMLNMTIFNSDDEYCHNYALLRPRDLPRYLGCRSIEMKPRFGLIVFAPLQLPLPLNELASRDELRAWLARVLLNTLVPGDVGEGRNRVRYPNNLGAFLNLLIHLRRVGFPAHWLADVVHNVLHDTFTTDVAPYAQRLPVPIADMNRRVAPRRVRLDPWRAELETLFALAYEALPFPVLRPAGFASRAADIGTYEAGVREAHRSFFLPPVPPFDAVVSLMFYRPLKAYNPQEFAGSMLEILEGRASPAKGDLQIVTVQEAVNVPGHVVRWRMSRKRVEKMKEEGWMMCAYRFDTHEIIINPVPAKNWKDVTPPVGDLPRVADSKSISIPKPSTPSPTSLISRIADPEPKSSASSQSLPTETAHIPNSFQGELPVSSQPRQGPSYFKIGMYAVGVYLVYTRVLPYLFR